MRFRNARKKSVYPHQGLVQRQVAHVVAALGLHLGADVERLPDVRCDCIRLDSMANVTIEQLRPFMHRGKRPVAGP